MLAVLQEFVQLLVGAIVDMATGLASGIVTMVEKLFLTTNATTGAVEGLSIFGGVVGIFSGIALCVGITTRIFLWISSLGNN